MIICVKVGLLGEEVFYNVPKGLRKARVRKWRGGGVVLPSRFFVDVFFFGEARIFEQSSSRALE